MLLFFVETRSQFKGFINGAHDQKQLYRLNETNSHSRGWGFEICFAVSFAIFWPFWPPNWSKIGQIFVCVLSIIPAHLVSKNPRIL